jgi:hypothetical protein
MRSVLLTVPVFSGQAVAGSTTSASQAVSVMKMSCTTRCSRLARRLAGVVQVGSLMAGFSPIMYIPANLVRVAVSARALSMISTTV